jgi:hypothetical protein
MKKSRAGLLSLLLLAACGGGDEETHEVMFPLEDYEASFEEVRDCRGSADHDFNKIRVLADAAALVPYRDRLEEFPEGAIVLKEEYEFNDETCEGEIIGYAVMVKLAAGADERNLDWVWQRVSPEGEVEEHNESRCASCHSTCVPPDGYGSTCALEDGGG